MSKTWLSPLKMGWGLITEWIQWLCFFMTTRPTLRVLKESSSLPLFTLLDPESAGGRVVYQKSTEYENEPGPPFAQRAVVSVSGSACPICRRRGRGGGGRQALQPAQLPLPALHIGLLLGCLCRLGGFHQVGEVCFIKVLGLHKEIIMISSILHRCD